MKSTLCAYLSGVLFVLAMGFGFQVLTGAGDGYKPAALVTFVLALIAFVGVFTLRMEKSEDANETEWSNAIR